jgi:hypothetical protein
VLVQAAAVTTNAVAYVTCKLDAAGNVADVVFTRLDGNTTSRSNCTGGSAAAVLAGGRNVLLDFTDSSIVQV